jgi:hypothetical protein
MPARYSYRPLGFLLIPILACGFAVPCQSEQSEQATDQTHREAALATERFAAERLWLWQQRLNLADWNISVVVARATELKPRTLGNIHWDAEKKRAVIKVLHPEDYNMPMKEMLADVEFTVVHELIHLELSSLPRSDASRSDEEHAVNQIARALLSLDRKR